LLVRAFIRQLGYQKEMSGLSDYQAVAPIFDAMMAEKIKEMSVSDVVGGGYPFPVAVHFMQLLEKYTDLSPGDDVLDIGCGCGRLAATLTQHISLGGSYRGVDIVPGLIRFANNHIATRWPHFQFMTLDQDNPAYNHWRDDRNVVNPIHSLEESYTPGSITLCIATSLFTHMDEAMIENTLRSIHAALAIDGRALVTLFLLDPSSRHLIDRGTPVFTFRHPIDHLVSTNSPQQGLGAVGVDLQAFLAVCAQSGLYVEKILYGAWPGRKHFVSAQDAVVLRKALS
jgi:SAM-dependent methyltransferase